MFMSQSVLRAPTFLFDIIILYSFILNSISFGKDSLPFILTIALPEELDIPLSKLRLS